MVFGNNQIGQRYFDLKKKSFDPIMIRLFEYLNGELTNCDGKKKHCCQQKILVSEIRENRACTTQNKDEVNGTNFCVTYSHGVCSQQLKH